MYDSRYADIPSSGVQMIDSIQHHFGDKELHITAYRQKLGDEFRQVCRKVARDKQTNEEKIIWVRAAINSINKSYVIANAKNDYGCTNLTAEFCAILESEFMQLPEPICVKRIAKEIGAMEIFEEKAVVGLTISSDARGNIVDTVSDENPDGQQLRMEYVCLFLLNLEMGAMGEFYQKKICFPCAVQDCPYDVYWRMFQVTGDDNEKYHCLTPMEADSTAGEEPLVVLPQLDGDLSIAQSYFEALYPTYIDHDLKWKNTNYGAYWFARLLKKQFSMITIKMVGDYFNISNLRSYRKEALARPNLRDSIIALLRKRRLDVQDVD